MEILSNGFTLELCEGAFPLSTDSIALAEFVKLPKNADVLDLGAGCGTLGLLLCAKDDACCVTGVEIDEKAHKTALLNIEKNKLEGRNTSICADLTSVSAFLKPGSFHVCLSNPPYFTGGFKSKTLPDARQETLCSLDAVFAAAAFALRYGGDFFIVHRPERLSELCTCGAKHHLEPKRLRLLRHRKSGPVSLVLLQCRKGGKTGLSWEEVHLHEDDRSPSDYYRTLYH